MTDDKTLYLIDGSAYIYRAYHAIRNLSNSSGMPTNAAYGFTRMLMKLFDDRSPDYVALFFDAKGPTFRHEQYTEYKANRPPMPDDLSVQIPYIKEISAGFNLPVLEIQGFEADDLIGTIARQAEAAGFSVVMVTGDKDFIQLVTDKATIWDPMKDKIIDMKSVRENFGVEPKQMIEVMGLSGDTADNVPGVQGIGPKTALTLIREFGNMDVLYEQVDTITKKKQKGNLITFKEQALLSRELVTIKTDAPVKFNADEYKKHEPDSEKLAELYKKLEFRQLQKDVPEKADLSKKKYKSILDRNALTDLVTMIGKAGEFAIDTETTALDPMKAELVGISISINPDEAFYIPVGHNYLNMPEQLDREDVLKTLAPVLTNPEIKKIGQNIKYDWIVLKRHGAELNGVSVDTMLESYLINPSKRAHGLDQIALDFLDHKTITYKEVVGTGKKLMNFSEVPIETAAPYACEDADITLMAHQILSPKVKDLNLVDLFEKVEMPLVPVLMKMEMRGIEVDKKALSTLSKTFEQELDNLEKAIYVLAGEEFNIKSSQQLGHILFEKLELPVQKKTKKKTGYSTDVNVLTTLADYHELPAHILRHRTIAKLKSTYADALLDLVNEETGRIHTSYNQTVTATGRLSSSDPNLQNIPIRTEEGRKIREAFVPQKDWLMLSADYSQIELRIFAHCSNDKILVKAFNEDEDIHARTAAEVFEMIPGLVDDELRRQAKIINFGIIYGMGAFSLSKELGISNKMAKTYINNYFSRYSGVKQFIDETIETARENKKISTLLGRIRLLPDIDSANKNIREFAERTAVNTPIQGTAADLIKVAMINVDRVFEEKGLKAGMLLSVHDEIVFEVPPDELEEVKTIVKYEMENVWDLKVPLKVNMNYGKNWSEAH
ncbi:MAG: DNA polymerase I [Desulfobacterales bacterium]|nr:DNA polymerase I [Desulfobacterales bacterium]